MSNIEILATIATALLTVEGVWILWTVRQPKLANVIMTTPAYGKKKKICVIFPSYKDVVDMDKWQEWGRGEDVKYIIAEDITNNNAVNKKKARLIRRNVRSGFKAGAVNNVLDQLCEQDEHFDYVMIFDADHVPYNNSIKEIYGFLNKEVIQFFWLDGLPLETPLNWLTWSSRYYSNWNIYNRAFANLTGSSIAIRFDLIKQDHIRFPETITEDYALTLQTIYQRKLRITIIPYILSVGSSPRSFHGYVKQQTRWAEGTVRDAMHYFGVVIGSPLVSFRGKLDFMLHVNMYLQGLWMMINYALLLAGGVYTIMVIPIVAFQAVAYMRTLAKTPKRYWLVYMALNYYMAVVQIYALARALTIPRGTFNLTDKNAGAYDGALPKPG